MWLCLLLTQVVAGFRTAQSHNPLAEWQAMFAAGWAPSNPGRHLIAGGPSIEFSTDQIEHRGYVDIHVSAPQLANNTEDCNVTYVAVFSPPDADLNKTTPIRYQAMVWNNSFCETGNATFRFQLNNLHTGGYRAYLLQGGVEQTEENTPITQLFEPNSKPFIAVGGLKAGPNAYLQSKILATSSHDVVFNNTNEPTHIRLTSGHTPGAYIVSWNQEEGTTGGYVKYVVSNNSNTSNGNSNNWNNSSNLSESVWEGNSTRVDADRAWTISLNDVCSHSPAAGPGFRSMGVTFSAELSLSEVQGETIYYAVGSSENASSPTYRFTVPLLPGATTHLPQEWVIYADQGVGYGDDSYSPRNLNNGRTAHDIAVGVDNISHARTLQAILVSGDVSYADGYLAQTEDYLDMTQNTFASNLCLISAGNHETDWYREGSSNLSFPNAYPNYNSPNNSTVTGDFWSTRANPDLTVSSGGECGLNFKIWPQVNATPSKPWYTYAAGLMTMVVWSTEHNFKQGSEQWLWLNTTLSKVNRSLTPWLFVTAHRPMYVSSVPDTIYAAFAHESSLFVQHVEPLYIQYNVSFTMSGHYHSTQRSCATLNYSCEQNSTQSFDGFAEYQNPHYPIHWLIGNAGANPDEVVDDFPFTVFSTATPAFGLVTIRSARILELQLIDPKTGLVLDQARILRTAPESEADCFDNLIIDNFFSNCTDADFSNSRSRACSSECQHAAHALQQSVDLPLDCLNEYANTTQRLNMTTVNLIKAQLESGAALCPTSTYSAASLSSWSPLSILLVVLSVL